ncbi:MAG: hypothetical protein HY332_24700 [Chloroflexi bacterium]|nr:hypothetical protein [Chloroflexota bacterium]
MQPRAIFVTDDRRMRDGQLDPTDEQVLRDAGGGGPVMQVSAEEALKLVDAERGTNTGFPSSPPPSDRVRALKPDEIQEMAKHADATVKYFRHEAARLMSAERAEVVRKLRVDKRYTWRKVARTCSEAWKTDWESNQLAGMAVCEAAAKYFLEDYMKPPWN